MARHLFTSESVTEGHPDKICDQVSDAILDAILDKEAELQEKGYVSPDGVPANVENVRCACETFVTTGTVSVAGEVRTEAYVDVQKIARDTIRRIGYDRAKYGLDCETCGGLNLIHEQSPDINRGVERQDPMEQGAGDQGMMFGYATDLRSRTQGRGQYTMEPSHYIELPKGLQEKLIAKRTGRENF